MRFTLFSCALLLIVINSTAQVSTAENGLNTPNSTTVRLGGTLLQTTTLDLGSYDFHFMKGGTPYFSILNNGNVGIGNSSPGARLTFPNVESSTDPFGLSWYGPDPLSYGIHRTAGSWLAPDYQQLRLSWLTGIVLDPGMSYGKSYVNIVGNGLRVTSGNVGIGTTSPGVALSLGGTVMNSKLAIWEGEYGGQIVRSGFGIAPGQFRFHVAGPNNRFSFLSDEAGTNEVLTILGTGKVGIGTTAPHNTFEVNTDGGDDNSFYIPNVWDAYSTRFNGGNVSIFSTGNSTTAGDSYQLSFYARYTNAGQGMQTNKGGFVKASVANDNNLYPGQAAGRGILMLGSTNTNYNDGVLKFIDMPTVYLNNGQVGIGTNSPTGRLHIKASTADASASDFLFTDNAGASILSIRNDQKFTLGSGTQNTQLSIAGTGPLSGIYSPVYASVANNIIAFRDFAGNTRMTLDMSSGTDGKLGIGTSNIGTAALAIEKSNNDGGATNTAVISVKNTSTFQPAGGGYNIAGANFFAGNGAVLGQCSANYGVGTDAPWNSGSGFYITTRTNDPIIFAAASSERMRIGANGNVGIGTTNISDATYKLFVEGNIRTRKVRVDHDNWPDYVFENNYQLTPLHEIEQYIQQQKHLPEVPSAAEVKKEGVDLGDNQAVLLKKIEELTLYVIQQQKQLEAQQQKIEALEKKMADKN